MKKPLIALIVLGLVGTGIWAFALKTGSEAQSTLKFAAITRGDLETVVSGTGTLNAVGTVEVGTQVSGTIDHLYVDFNDNVDAGQLMARLDTSALAASVRDAEAIVARARAQHNQALDEYGRNVPLAEKGYISELELRVLATGVETAKAGLLSAEAGLTRMQTNLRHAEIRAPIDGTVIQRSVEAGQTVAASLQAPVLFTIAEDLAQMEILALVDESDIGQIRVNQEVRFTVQAHPDENFQGTVRQIRLQPQTIQNVVNYTVVVDADNAAGLLLPGMTATVDFVVERAADVLLLPAAAARFQPTEEMLAALMQQRRERTAAQPDSLQGRGERARSGDRRLPGDIARVWYLDDSGVPDMVMVRTGATDGLMTEISIAEHPERPGPAIALTEGMEVITGTTSSSSTGETASTSPSSSPRGRRMGPPGLF